MVNHTEWMNGRLSTMMGARMSEYFNRLTTPAALTERSNKRFSYNVGATYQLTDWLHPYVGASDTYNQPPSTSNDPYGALPKLKHGIGGECGCRWLLSMARSAKRKVMPKSITTNFIKTARGRSPIGTARRCM